LTSTIQEEVAQVRISPDDWSDALDDADGRQVIVAGPGTGKTEFLVRRVARIITSERAASSEVVVLSFSRRASARLRARIEDAVGATGVPIDVTTFHSLAIRLAETASGGQRPLPLTTPEQIGLVRQILRTEDPGEWPLTYRGILDSHAFSAEVADFLLRCSERLLSPVDLAVRARTRADWKGLPGLYERYLATLEDMGRTDYGVLLSRAVDLLRTSEGASVAASLRYVLVDEYQDTSPAQAEMAELLARPRGNLTVTGDPYQSIFSFRGAEVRNIAAFSQVPGTKRIVLAESFRVPKPIMDAALRVVSGGDLPGSAGPVTPAPHQGRSEVYVFDQETGEAEWIAREVEHLVRVDGISPADIAVVVRSKKELLAELSRALDRRSLPHDPPDSRLVDHPAVQAMGDLVVAATKGGPVGDVAVVDSDLADRSIRRVLLGPLFGTSLGLEREIARDRRRTGRPWGQVVAHHLPDRPGLIGLLTDADWAQGMGAADGFWEVWTRLEGIAEMIDDPGRDEWRRAWTSFGQMLGRQTERDPKVTLARFFELVDEDDFEATPLISHRLGDERVTLTTLHQAKGLEFDVVFIANAVEGVFPDLRRSRRMLRPELLSPEMTVDPEAQHLFQVQEEMRLAYTAMTRARRRVVWTATEAGVDQGERRPSRFLLAAAGNAVPGPPKMVERDPITLHEAETVLRRDLLDAGVTSSRRLAAARVLGMPSRPWWDAMAFAGVIEPGPDQGVIVDSFRLSPSQAESYESCPRRYVLERRLRLGDATSVYAQFGEKTHDVLERAEGEVIGTGARHADLARVLEIVDEVWEDADFGTPELNEAWKKKAIKMLSKLYEQWPGKGVPVEVELDVEASIDGIQWIGRIDRLEETDQGYRVVDYKSGTRVPTYDEAAQSIQLAFYTMAVEQTRGEVVASEMWFPRGSSKSVDTRNFAGHRLVEVVGRMQEITGSIGDERWEPRVSNRCTNCAFRRSCPAWPEGKGAFLP
jgi:superfamily I DNA/RNA helicase/CRISPR/Cas system-associated exonuclease Cas4 (RecB family)